ncbi:MAG: YbaN family protein [Melioribacteraceae bacterium]|nr:YbaN family protein [Melioribacteraceae bacterium]
MTQKKAKNRITRFLLIIGGSLALFLGVLGVFLPLLPTTPFLLLSAYCFGRSSDRIHTWLINNKWFGEYIKNYQAGKGIPTHSKVTAILSMWILLIASAIWGTELLIVRIVLLLIGTGVTIHLLRMPTFRGTKKYRIDLNEKG